MDVARAFPVSTNTPTAPAAHLLCEGLAIAPALLEVLEPLAHWVPAAFSQQRVELELIGEPCVRLFAPVRAEEHPPPAVPRLVREGSAWAIELSGVRYPVRFPPRPRFATQQTTSGQRMGDIAWLADSVLFVLPSSACGYGLSGSTCRFCRVGSRSSEEAHSALSPGDVAEVVQAAGRERHLHHVLFPALSSFDLEDGGVAQLEPWVRAARRHTTGLVAASLHPPRSLRWLDHAYAVGIDAIGIHLEAFEVESLARILPGRARYLGKSRYIAALRHAARIFPRGAVWSEIVVGWQPLKQVLAAAEQLVEMGVVPLVVPFRNRERAPTFGVAPPTAVELTELGQALLGLLRKHELAPIWLPELPHALPLSRVPASSEGREGALWQAWLRSSPAGLFFLTNLARLRRVLRVRPLEEFSTEAGHAV